MVGVAIKLGAIVDLNVNQEHLKWTKLASVEESAVSNFSSSNLERVSFNLHQQIWKGTGIKFRQKIEKSLKSKKTYDASNLSLKICDL